MTLDKDIAGRLDNKVYMMSIIKSNTVRAFCAMMVLMMGMATPASAQTPPVISCANYVGSPIATPNTLGVVPVLEYHRIGTINLRWQITPSMLMQNLYWLYSHDFYLITFGQLTTGDIHIPFGMHPAVLTFDDGSPNQFQWNAKHQPLPTSAVGVLTEFHTLHPSWPVTATFFVNKYPFGQDSQAKLQWLVANGYEIGNHTYDHANLNVLNSQEINAEVGKEELFIATAVPGYRAISFALPYGGLPTNQQDRSALLSGSYGGVSWNFKGVALVGGNPSPSPLSKNFHPTTFGVPRIQVAAVQTDPSSASYLFAGWQQWMLNNQSKLYTSPGCATAGATLLNAQSPLLIENFGRWHF